jgi:hypothetical protein
MEFKCESCTWSKNFVSKFCDSCSLSYQYNKYYDGKTFNKLNKEKLYAFVNKNDVHKNILWKNEVKYVEGLNFDNSCESHRSFYFRRSSDLFKVHNLDNNFMYEVEIPDDSTINICFSDLKTNKFILKNKKLLNKFFDERDEKTLIKYIKQEIEILSYINNQIRNICLAAVNHNDFALKHIKICLFAVKQNKNVIKHVKNEHILHIKNILDLN